MVDMISRGNLGTLVPDTITNNIIQELPKSSVILQRGNISPMSTKVGKQSVLTELPDAFWVNGDTGLKRTTKAEWDTVTITAEELAVLVPIPDAVLADASVPLWGQIQPLIAAAIGRKIDEAALFGIDKPASWADGVIPSAITAGNVVQDALGNDLALSVAKLGEKLADDGFSANGFASTPGFNWRLVQMRDTNGSPVYHPAVAEGQPATLYGYGLSEVTNGSWQKNAALLLAADWSKFIVGIRQDFSWDIFNSGVINDADGKVLFNAMQQDSSILRVTFRAGFAVANPVTALNSDSLTRYPAAVLTPADGGS